MRHALDGSSTGPDNPDPLVGQSVHQRARRIAAGVIVIPSAGMERVSPERFNTGDTGEFWDVQRTRPHADELRRAAIGVDVPARPGFVPFQIHDLGVKQRVVVETILFADALAVLKDFRCMRVFFGRHVSGFFEQRHIDKRSRVALGSRISVPVPCAAEITALLDDKDGNARLRKPRGGGEPRETAADERESHVVGLRLARGNGRIGIFKIVGELPLELKILIVAVGAEPLVALLEVFLA
jgi:hypothetical protein